MVDTYTKPWCRATPYLVGFWGGLLLDHFRHKKLDLTWWQVLLGWALAITVGMLVVYGMADYNTLVDPKLLTQAVSIPYEGLSRGAWALAVLWFIQTTGILFIGGIAAVIISLIAEGPVLGLEKLLLRRPGRGEGSTEEPKKEATS
ncbi:hypothetical protein Pcinc_018308 [Petrolisthes cinctipes]|uniref:Uncharacterized protein n=1 Tax=Petrolisthes cinctipes TaxID=88211 RepID=A0AAE1FN78_PETCI|nr:hypothetical protein Pcinc_018308 [Petrolisthes cinctipes]